MTGPVWEGTITVRCLSGRWADALERTMAPEAAREVPRTTATVRRSGEREVVIALTARDTGALRAGLNTYLGWIDLAERTARVARQETA